MEILSPFSENIGVFYPLQTFTSERAIELADVPILIEANRISNEDALLELAGRISKNTSVADSQRRERIHIAAVFAGNFSNHMYALAKKLLEDNGYDYELLAPLIRETAQKAIDVDPMSAQTGPARREDQEIIDRHLQLLNNEPVIRELYEKISASIRDQYRSK